MEEPNKKYVEISARELVEMTSSMHSEETSSRDKKLTHESQLLNKRFPFLGVCSIIGSLLTFAISAILLHLTNNKPIRTYLGIKPNSWLNIILSINALLLRQAIAEGINISWWYRASKTDTTVGDLHRTWAQGTSFLDAVTGAASKRFNTIALATLFCATIPLNGFLLQNSLDTSGVYDTIHKPFSLSMAQTFPPGYSAALNSDKSVGNLNSDFRYWAPKVATAYSGDGRLKLEGQSHANASCDGYCQMILRGVGFATKCSSYNIPYRLPADSSRNLSVTELPIFDIGYGWSASAPNTMKVNTVSKVNQTCSGQLIVTNCTLQMATVDYFMAVDDMKDLAGTQATWAVYTYNSSDEAAWEKYGSEFRPSTNIALLPVTDTDNQTTFGGIAQVIGSYFNSTVKYRHFNGSADIIPDGSLANTWGYSTDKQNATDATSYVPITDQCEIAFGSSDLGNNITSYALETVRSMLMFLSIEIGSEDIANEQTVTSSQDLYVQIYIVDWKWLWASFAVTVIINLFIMPTYWGYWTLHRKTTMSPVETMRAFQAPGLNAPAGDIETGTLVKQIGSKKVHVDSSSKALN